MVAAESQRKVSGESQRGGASVSKSKLIAGMHRSLSNQAVTYLLSKVAAKPCAKCSGGSAPCPRCAAEKPRNHLESIQQQLGHGSPLDSSVRSRMLPLFGDALSDVRIHTGHSAAQLANRFDARAFVVGNHIAFGAGEYRPGTVAGDVLIAHELAHTAQQSGGGRSASASSDALERDADRSAATVARALWAKFTGAAGAVRHDALPRLRSGLRLARCGRGLRIPGNSFGNWDIDQKLNSGSGPGNEYSSEVHIWFNPNTQTVDCSEIAFVQAVNRSFIGGGTAETRAFALARQTPAGWKVDRLVQRQYGWYGYNNDGRPSGTVVPGSSPSPEKSAELMDTPRWSVGDVTWSFETCAICKAGTQQNSAYACLTWGFEVDSDSKLMAHTPVHQDAPSAEFTAAVGAWNTQAAGPAASRNAPAQQPLGPFK